MKRAPKSSVKRKVFEVPGPGVAGAVPLDARARAVFAYFKKYNYEVWHSGAAHVRAHSWLFVADVHHGTPICS